MKTHHLYYSERPFIGVISFSAMWILFLVITGCNPNKSSITEHFFLKGYDQLVLRDSLENPIPPSQYISAVLNSNGLRSYQIIDTSLTLMHRRSGEPYSGYIRTFHMNAYNLQGEYKDGKIFRLRFWYPNRILGMDTDFRSGETKLWDRNGMLLVTETPEETYTFYQGTQRIKEIRRDTMHSFFDMQGNLTRYNIYTDSTMTFYYGDGSRRLELPYSNGSTRDGIARRWHPNGQLQAVGEYRDGQQYGIWMEYDSLGNEIKREVFEP